MGHRNRFAAIGVFLLTFALPTAAPAEVVWERLLVPLYLRQPVAGGFGSLWATELVVSNRSETRLETEGIATGCPFDPCVGGAIFRGETTVYAVIHGPQYAHPARMIWVEEGRLGDLDVQLRIRDLSRETLSWGTELPVIPESRSLTGPSGLLDLPIRADSRLRLRLYAFSPPADGAIRIRGYSLRRANTSPFQIQPDPLLFDFVTAIAPTNDLGDVGGYSELDLSTLALPSNVEQIRLRLDPADPEMKYWAFVSITNNETQHITLVTPQLR